MRFELKWVAVNSNELKLWENDGTGLKIISRCLPGQKTKKKIFFLLKIALTPISIAGNMVYNMPSLLSANGWEYHAQICPHLYIKAPFAPIK